MSSNPSPLRRLLPWIALLYFSEGLPFGIVYDLLPVYFRSAGVSLRDIGLLSLLGMPWSLKVLWSPLVDRLGERRHWIVGCQIGLAAVLAALPIFPANEIGTALRVLLLCLTTFSATQDIAIDAYTIGITPRGAEGPVNSLRVSAYRAALIVGGGGLVALSGLLGWRVVISIGAAIFLALAAFSWHAPRETAALERRREFDELSKSAPDSSRPLSPLAYAAARVWSEIVWLFGPLIAWLRRPYAIFVLIFVLIYKLADASMGPMVKPFWVDRGLTPAEIGLISTTVGVLATVLGAIAGGIFVKRYGIFHGLWVLGLLQALSNLGYAAVAYFDLPRGGIYAASVVESFTGGLGTAAFLSFLMHLCDRQHAAVQYALLSALFGLSRSLAGGVSGWGAERLGYAKYFALTFLLAFPAYALLRWVKTWITDRPAAAPSLDSAEGS
ncbi:MAG: MFS transporter [Candidatus Eisenbacteria bacterium]|nr:MFS transporter [Candidatus Eisenbacteria bacterium]